MCNVVIIIGAVVEEYLRSTGERKGQRQFEQYHLSSWAREDFIKKVFLEMNLGEPGIFQAYERASLARKHCEDQQRG